MDRTGRGEEVDAPLPEHDTQAATTKSVERSAAVHRRTFWRVWSPSSYSSPRNPKRLEYGPKLTFETSKTCSSTLLQHVAFFHKARHSSHSTHAVRFENQRMQQRRISPTGWCAPWAPQCEGSTRPSLLSLLHIRILFSDCTTSPCLSKKTNVQHIAKQASRAQLLKTWIMNMHATTIAHTALTILLCLSALASSKDCVSGSKSLGQHMLWGVSKEPEAGFSSPINFGLAFSSAALSEGVSAASSVALGASFPPVSSLGSSLAACSLGASLAFSDTSLPVPSTLTRRMATSAGNADLMLSGI